MTEKMATREAYGKTLVALGEKYKDLVVMDADLSGSTKTAMFKRFIRNGSSIWGSPKTICTEQLQDWQYQERSYAPALLQCLLREELLK